MASLKKIRRLSESRKMPENIMAFFDKLPYTFLKAEDVALLVGGAFLL